MTPFTLDDSELSTLCETFQLLSHSQISAIYGLLHGDMSATADVLASGPSSKELLQLFGSSMKAGTRINASIDEGNFLRDVFHLYKNPSLDIKRPIVVEYMGQPAIDVGGVRRHFFTDIINRMTSASELQLFEGSKQALLPVANSQYLMSGLFRMFGRIVVHSIINGGPCLSGLAPSCYWYLATKNIECSIPFARMDDLTEPASSVVSKVRTSFCFELSNQY